jgi:uncharacterized membrane protein
MDPFSPIRATTVHPALVHFTLGVVPVFLVAYAIASARRSPRWTFAGDVAVWIGAALTPATVASGLVSNALVSWPSGMQVWRWLHLGLAVASAALYLALAVARLRALHREAVASRGTVASALALALLLGATGWIGGEVLVFHSGIAVAAAAHGALAPPMSRVEATPADLHDAMGRLRASWAEAQTTFARMLVQRPSAEGYARIAIAARDLALVASWLETQGPEAIVRQAHAPGVPALELHGAVAEMAAFLGERARELEQAARDERWSSVTRALEGVTRSCAGCHQAARWREETDGAAHEH